MKVSLKGFMEIQRMIHEVRDRLKRDGVQATYL
jgi:hypothetical protein